MKTVSLNIVQQLAKIHGDAHTVSAITIHPATHLFFNPWDKKLKGYYSGDYQEMSCAQLLSCHTA